MGVKFANNAATTLAAGISSGATSFQVASATGFPSLGGSDYMYLTVDSEVIKVTATSGTTFSCDATSSSHSSGDTVELRMSAELLDDFAEDSEALPLSGGQMSGNITMAGSQTVDGRDLSADGTKLDGIEASATADQTNAEIRAAVEAASDSNVFTDADHSKLNAIEASATADQTNAEIRTAVEAATDSNVFTDADHTKLNAIEASADVTDATNVAAAGALMKSGGTMTGNTVHGDNVKDTYGASADLEIYHDGSNSYVKEVGTGNLKILADNLQIKNSADNELKAYFDTNGGAALYHDNGLKIETTSGGATVTGNIAVTGTVDGVDIATRDAVLTSTTTTANAALPKAGGTMTGNVTHADNVKAQFGASNDLEIYHDGGDTYIKEVGTGALYIASNEIKLVNSGANENVLVGVEDGTVRIYHDNVKKFETTAQGVTVTGTAVASTATFPSNSGNVLLDFGTYQNFVYGLTGNATLVNPSTEQVGQSGFITFTQDSTGGRTVSLGTDYETAGGAGLTLTSTANATDVIPYIVVASNRILLGTPQLAFA